MLISQKYTINKNFIPGLPQIAFRGGVGAYEGVCMHATAVYNDSADGERNYESTHFQDAFVHTFTDDSQILQVADMNHISWGCCETGNQFLLNNELCQSYDADKFAAAYDRWVWLAAYQLYQRKLGVVDAKTIWSHKEVSDTYHESDHQDPIEYLAEHSKTWQDVVNDVSSYYNQFEQEETNVSKETGEVFIAWCKFQYSIATNDADRQTWHNRAEEVRQAAGLPQDS